ncbi:MAG: siderophore-interacting protein [Acidimicrobiia bacterium]|nr:siderophore-interacting protein [Acidimicrobiia bacterium]
MATVRTRREPPPFRPVRVARTEQRTPYLVRVTLGGPALDGLELGLPAASVRVLLPEPGARDVVIPTWEDNEFLNADGTRPLIRTLTPLRLDTTTDTAELDVDVVCHGDSPLTTWATTAVEGTPAAVSGTGRGYEIDPAATDVLLVGDESALPAISTVIPALPVTARVRVLAEVRAEDGAPDLPDHPGLEVQWCLAEPDGAPGSAMVAALAVAEVGSDSHVWAAGEAAAVQRIRKHLFDTVGLARSHAVVRGYWKVGRAERG